MNPEEHAKLSESVRAHAAIYGEIKMSVMLPTDINQLRRLSELVNSFPTARDYGELVDIESELSVLVFNLQGVITRLGSQGKYTSEELDRKIFKRAREIVAAKLEDNPRATAVKTAADQEARGEFEDERLKLGLCEDVATEYKKKIDATKEVFLAITHRLKKLSRESDN